MAPARRLAVVPAIIVVGLLNLFACLGSAAPSTHASTWPELSHLVTSGDTDSIASGHTVSIASDILFPRCLDVWSDQSLFLESRVGARYTLSGGATSRLFYLHNKSTLSIRNLDLTHGRCQACRGGAIFVGHDSELELHSVRLSRNQAMFGGAIYARNASVFATGCILSSNTATPSNDMALDPVHDGGAIYALHSNIVATNCTFTFNSGDAGGVVYASGVTAVLFTDSQVASNSANWGGVILADQGSTVTATNSRMASNRAAMGGVFYAHGGSIIAANHCFLSFNSVQLSGGVVRAYDTATFNASHCSMTSNTANSGGVAHSKGTAMITMTNCEMTSNRAYYGAVVATDSYSSALLTDCEVAFNSAAWGVVAMVTDDTVFIAANLTIIANMGDVGTSGGGAIYADRASTATLIECTMMSNSALDGGAIHAAGNSAVFVTGGAMTYNHAQYGGAIHAAGDSIITVSNCTINSNVAHQGGAVSTRDSGAVTATDCTMTLNSAFHGGVFFSTDVSNVTAVSCTIVANKAKRSGGVFLAEAASTVAATNCMIASNAAADVGGGVCANDYSMLIIAGCTVASNEALNAGGAIAASGSATVYATDCTMTSNSARWGGAVATAYDSTLIATDCTMVSNTAYAGGAISTTVGSATSTSTVRVIKCHMASNSAQFGGGFYAGSSNSNLLESCTMKSNSAQYGGSVYAGTRSTFDAANCTMDNNRATNDGGAVFLASLARSLLIKCQLAENSANAGGALAMYNSSSVFIRQSFVDSNFATTVGGALLAINVVVGLLNSDIRFNSNADGGAESMGIENVDSELICDALHCLPVCTSCENDELLRFADGHDSYPLPWQADDTFPWTDDTTVASATADATGPHLNLIVYAWCLLGALSCFVSVGFVVRRFRCYKHTASESVRTGIVNTMENGQILLQPLLADPEQLLIFGTPQTSGPAHPFDCSSSTPSPGFASSTPPPLPPPGFDDQAEATPTTVGDRASDDEPEYTATTSGPVPRRELAMPPSPSVNPEGGTGCGQHLYWPVLMCSPAAMFAVDQEMRIIMWSPGMSDAASTHVNPVGCVLSDLPFMTKRHGDQVYDSISEVIGRRADRSREDPLTIMLHLRTPNEPALLEMVASVFLHDTESGPAVVLTGRRVEYGLVGLLSSEADRIVTGSEERSFEDYNDASKSVASLVSSHAISAFGAFTDTTQSHDDGRQAQHQLVNQSARREAQHHWDSDTSSIQLRDARRVRCAGLSDSCSTSSIMQNLQMTRRAISAAARQQSAWPGVRNRLKAIGAFLQNGRNKNKRILAMWFRRNGKLNCDVMRHIGSFCWNDGWLGVASC